MRTWHSQTKAIHLAVVTTANIADSAVPPVLLHGDETDVWGDQAYRGQSAAIHELAPQAQDQSEKPRNQEER
jgi:IS5 family transposase